MSNQVKKFIARNEAGMGDAPYVCEHSRYLMENEDEAIRLDIKTNRGEVEKQALWAGIAPGMRVVDLGCGSGKTSSTLSRLVQPGGSVVGVDFSSERVEFARKHYGGNGAEFRRMDIREPLDELGTFDFVWIRFVLEYYLSDSLDIVKNTLKLLKPGGILCLLDLDHNCLSHYGLSPKLEKTFSDAVAMLMEKANFDPYVGRKLYSFLYDLGFKDIDVGVEAHHLIFGELKNSDAFNWFKKVEVIARKLDFGFEEYGGEYKEFLKDFNGFFSHPRRFTYTPIICCRGVRPAG